MDEDEGETNTLILIQIDEMTRDISLIIMISENEFDKEGIQPDETNRQPEIFMNINNYPGEKTTPLLIKSFFPFISHFLFICFIYNFMKWVDELIGKGLEVDIILKFIIYGTRLVPLT